MNDFNPLVSIVIPVYNGANFMREAIDSALNQTYKNIEIIVVNDGSTDDGETEKIALSYGDKIRYFKKENGGCASALNFGISKMQGEWFSWLSHDDVYYPEKIQSAIDTIAEKNFTDKKTIVMCATEVIDSQGRKIPTRRFKKYEKVLKEDEMFSYFMFGKALNGCALLIPRTALIENGDFSTEYVYILDTIYWIELVLKGYNFYASKDVLSQNRRHDNQVSTKKKILFREETEKYLLELIERYENDKNKLFNIWLYCKQIGFVDGYNKVQQIVRIPLSIKTAGLYRVAYNVLYEVAKYCIRLIKK